MKKLLRPWLLLMLTIGSNVFVYANEEPVFLDVEQAFSLTTKQSNNLVNLQFDIAPGYYLYKKKFNTAVKNATSQDVVLPTGKTHHDEFFGEQEVYRDKLDLNLVLTDTTNEPTLVVSYQGCADEGLCYPPKKKTILLSSMTPMPSSSSVGVVIPGISAALSKTVAAQTTANETTGTSEQYKLENILAGDSFLWSVLMFFVIGVGLSFTPCVFPMYPILTGIIVGQGSGISTKKAFILSLFYVQGMAVTYTLLGVVVALAGLQFQAAFQHPVVLISLSILFIFLALSMFGVFNLALPSSWQTKLNQLSNSQKGGSLVGVVAMGMISGLVASPCTTAPLTAALLYIAKSGDVMLGAIALYSLSLGMGVPLIILGTSGGKLLPKAGNWMNIIKNVFGFLLLAVPVFLLERLLPEFVSNIIWLALFLAFATYLYVNNTKSKSEFWYGVRSLTIFLMLFIGAQLAYEQVVTQPSNLIQQQSVKHFKKVDSLSALNHEIKQANNQGKTVLVDLYADWCIACKEFERYTFFNPKSQQALADTVLIQVDLTDTSSGASVEVMEHFEVMGLPTILLFDQKGQELKPARITGFMNAPQFTAHISQSL